jgi:hypothetical protein
VAKVVEAEGEARQAGQTKCVPEFALGDGGRILRCPNDRREDEVAGPGPSRACLLLEQDEPGTTEHRHDAFTRRCLRRRDDAAVIRGDDANEASVEVDPVPA